MLVTRPIKSSPVAGFHSSQWFIQNGWASIDSADKGGSCLLHRWASELDLTMACTPQSAQWDAYSQCLLDCTCGVSHSVWSMEGYLLFFVVVRGRFWIFGGVPGSMLSCFSDFLLVCFSAYIASLLFLLLCFSASLLFCFPAIYSCFSASLLFAFPASLLFLLLCFSAFCFSCFFAFLLFCFSVFSASLLFLLLCFSAFAFPAFLLFCFSVFSASLLLYFCAFLLLLFYFSFSSVMCFCCSTSCSFASLLPVFTVSLFFIFFCFILFCLYPKWNPRETLGETQRNLKEILIRNPTWSPKWTLKKPWMNPKETIN